MATFKDYTTICSSAPSEILALIALRTREKILARRRERISDNLSLLDAFFQRHKDRFAWIRPRGGTVCFPRLLGEESTEALAERVIAKTGIMVLPSTVYGYGDHHFRLGFGRQNMSEILTRFEDFMKTSPA